MSTTTAYNTTAVRRVADMGSAWAAVMDILDEAASDEPRIVISPVWIQEVDARSLFDLPDTEASDWVRAYDVEISWSREVQEVTQ